jgi:hypothetical protein
MIEIDLEQALPYNSMIELQEVLPKTEEFQYTTMLACAMRDRNIHLILIMPTI